MFRAEDAEVDPSRSSGLELQALLVPVGGLLVGLFGLNGHSLAEGVAKIEQRIGGARIAGVLAEDADGGAERNGTLFVQAGAAIGLAGAGEEHGGVDGVAIVRDKL